MRASRKCLYNSEGIMSVVIEPSGLLGYVIEMQVPY